MGRHRAFTIKESLAELEGLKPKVTDHRSSQQLKALISIRAEQYSTLTQIASHLGMHYTTLQRWLRRYREQGIEDLPSPIMRNRPSKFITPKIHQEIEARLHSREDPFSGYVEVQQGLSRTYDVHDIFIKKLS